MVRTLYIDDERFDVSNRTSLMERVTEFLARRANPDDGDGEIGFAFSREVTDIEIFNELMEKVASHRLPHLWVKGFQGRDDWTSLSGSVFVSISKFGQSLDTLELEEFQFDGSSTFTQPLCSAFEMLTDLSLSDCVLCFISGKRLNPFAHFPALRNLTLSSFSRYLGNVDDPESRKDRRAILEVNGDQLLNLEIDKADGFSEFVVLATNLTSFTLRHQNVSYGLPLTKVSLNVPSLERADIRMTGYECLGEQRMQKVHKQYAQLIRGLRTARELVFEFDTTNEFYDACMLLGDGPSPFERLQSLTLRHNNELRTVIPLFVKVYFFGSHPPEPVYGNYVTMMIRP